MRRVGVLLVLLLLLMGGMSSALAEDLDDQLDDVSDEIASIRDQISSAEGRSSRLADDILATDARLRVLVADLELATTDLEAITAEVEATRRSLDETRADLEAQYRSLEVTRIELFDTTERAQERALRIYMNGGEDLGTVIFDLADISEVGVGVEYASQVMESTDQLLNGLEALEVQAERQAEIIERQQARLEEDVARLSEQQQLAEQLATLVATRKAEVESELASQRARLDHLNRELAHFEEELDGLQAEQARIERLIKEAEAKAQGPAPSGIFVRPVPGGITSGFGPRTHPILGTVRMHTGVDMTAGSGTPIRAAAAGTVIHASGLGGYGNTVIIAHGGGISTLYAHQSSIAVSNGSSVSAGQVVGAVGSTGLSTGPHLHFEVRRNGSPVDPVPFL